MSGRGWRGVVLGLVMALADVAAEAADAWVVSDDGALRLRVHWDAPVMVDIRRGEAALEIGASEPYPAALGQALDQVAADIATLSLAAERKRLTIRPEDGFRADARLIDDRSLTIELGAVARPRLGLRLGQHATFVRAVIEPVARHAVTIERDERVLRLALPGDLGPTDRQRLADIPGIVRVAASPGRLELELATGATVREHFVGPDRQVLDVTAPAPHHGLAELRPRARPSLAPRARAGALPEASAHGASPGEAQAAAPSVAGPGSFAALAIAAREVGEGTVEVDFVWPEAVPAVAFRRGAELWVGFAATAESIDLDTEAFARTARYRIAGMRNQPHEAATLLRLTLKDPAPATLRRLGGTWRLRIGAEDAGMAGPASPLDAPGDGRPGAPAAAPVVLAAAGDAVRVAGLDAIVTVVDPLVGDRLTLGMATAETAMSPDRLPRYVGVRFLPSLQGVVWRQLGGPAAPPARLAGSAALGPARGVILAAPDSTTPAEPPILAAPAAPESTGEAASAAAVVDPTSNAAAAAMPATASVTPLEAGASRGSGGEPTEAATDHPAGEPDAAAPSTPTGGRPLDLTRHRAGPGRHFWDRRAALLQALATAEGDVRRALELALARLLVVHGLGLEALALLGPSPDDVAATVTFDGEPVARIALTGAAQLLAGRHAAAAETLADGRLRWDAETALWRGAALAAAGQWDEALEPWQQGESFLDGYASATQAALGQHGAMLLLQTGRIDEAFALLERLAALRLPGATADRIRVLEAMALERDGAVDEAHAIWRRLAREGSPEARSRALLAAIELDLVGGRIGPEQATARLEQDRVHWRGQRDEIMLERRLAALQRAAGHAEQALATLRGVIDRVAAPEIAAAIKDEMAEVMDGLFQSFAAGGLAATRMLALYRDHAELVGNDLADDRKIDALAQGLVGLGLDQAAIGLLRERMSRRTARDAGRAALGLALARLLAAAGDARGALGALVDSTPVEAIAPDLASARRDLMVALDRSSEAVEATAPADVRDRARQLFDRRAWDELTDLTAARLATLPADGPVDAAASELILMLAIAAHEAGDRATIGGLAATFAHRLDAADAAVLQLLDGHPDFAGDAPSILAEAAAHLRRTRDTLATLPGP